jgi:hypothetical protein
MKKFKIEIEGDDEIIDSAINSFCLQHGFQPSGVGPMVPIEQIHQEQAEFARGVLRQFMLESILVWDQEQAKRQAEIDQREATIGKLLQTTMTAEVSTVDT